MVRLSKMHRKPYTNIHINELNVVGFCFGKNKKIFKTMFDALSKIVFYYFSRVRGRICHLKK